MYTVTDNYKKIAKSNFSTPTAKINIGTNSITQSDDLISINIKHNIFNETFVGTANCRTAEISFFDNPKYNFKVGSIIDNIMFGYKETVETVPTGTFIVDEEPSFNKTTKITTIKCRDLMRKFDKKWVDSNTYPMSMINFVKSVCTFVGVPLSNTIFPNSTFMIKEKPFFKDGTLCREVIRRASEIAASFCIMTRDDKLLFNYNYGINTETINKNNYNKDIEIGNLCGKINRVVLKLGGGVEGENVTKDDTTTQAQYGINDITIVDNPFIYNQELRNAAITEIFNTLNGISYYPVNMTYYGYPYSDCGDLITVNNIQDSPNNTFIFSHELSYNGGITGKIESNAIKSTENKYPNPPTIKERLSNTELTVDKQNKKITSLTSQVETVEVKIEKVKESWRGPDIPTLANVPAVNWTTDIIKDGHLDEVYFCDNNGINYIFTKTSSAYLWEEQTDNRIINNQTSINNTNNNINNNYDSKDVTQKKINDTKREVIETTSAMMTQTMNSFKFNLYKELKYDEVTGSITELKNTLITIDIDGLKVNANSSAFNTLMNNVGFYILDGTSPVSKLDKTGTSTKNLVVEDSIKKFGLIIEKKVVTNGVASVKGYWIKGGV
ncbi:MAG: hypothetical protein RR832_05295 [Bacilli bacterium]